jgi:hypothetical protein
MRNKEGVVEGGGMDAGFWVICQKEVQDRDEATGFCSTGLWSIGTRISGGESEFSDSLTNDQG